MYVANAYSFLRVQVAAKLGNTPFVFMMVVDMFGEMDLEDDGDIILGETIEAEEDEIMITKENMKGLYGQWLEERRRFALIK